MKTRSLKYRSVRLIISLVAMAALWATAGKFHQGTNLTAAPVANAGATYKVVRVIDGDTIVVAGQTSQLTVRLLNLDTPEVLKPNTPVACYGPEASAHTKELLPAGTDVALAFDHELKDKYDRTLAWVARSDGLDVNAELVRDGYAKALVIEPNSTKAAEFNALQAQAKAARSGLWGAC